MTNIKEQDWERGFDEKFGYLLGPIKVKPYYGEDVTKANLLQEEYNKIGYNIKDFIRSNRSQLLQEIEERVKELKEPDPSTQQGSYSKTVCGTANDTLGKVLTIITSFKKRI